MCSRVLRSLTFITLMLLAGTPIISGGSIAVAQEASTLTINALNCPSPGPDALNVDPNDCDATPGAGIEFSVATVGMQDSNAETGVTDDNGVVTFELEPFDIGSEPLISAGYTPLSNPAGEVTSYEVACYDAGGAPYSVETYINDQTAPGTPPFWGIRFFLTDDQITCDWISYLQITEPVDPTPPPDDGDTPAEEGPTPDGWNRELFSTLCAEPPPGPGPIYAPYEGCEAAEGVTMIVTDEAGETTFGTCETTSPSSAEGAASCFVVIPYDTTAVITQDPATVPEGYVPLDESQTFQAPAAEGPIGALERNLLVNVLEEADEPEPTETTAPPSTVSEPAEIGFSRADWEAVYGEGTPADDLVEYPNAEFDDFTVFVGYEDDVVAHIEFGYEEADAGGLPERPVADQLGNALPDDAEIIDLFTVPAAQPNGTTLDVIRYESASLADVTDGRGTILVVNQEQDKILNPGSPAGTFVVRMTLTIPSADLPETAATGDPGGLSLSRADWEAAYGEGEVTERGVIYDNVTFPISGEQVLIRTGEADWINYLEFTYDEGSQLGGAPVEDVAVQVAGAVPADAELVASFYLPATPDGPTPLRAELWESESLAETTGGSGSVMVVFEEETAQQNPDAPEQTVVTRVRMTIAIPDPE